LSEAQNRAATIGVWAIDVSVSKKKIVNNNKALRMWNWTHQAQNVSGSANQFLVWLK